MKQTSPTTTKNIMRGKDPDRQCIVNLYEEITDISSNITIKALFNTDIDMTYLFI